MFQLFRDAYAGWSSNKAPMMAAALAYYALFAIAPLLVIVIELGALVVGGGASGGHHHEVERVVLEALSSALGDAGAQTVADIVTSTLSHRSQGLLPSLLGWGVSLYAAANLFGALRDALNAVWEVPVDPNQTWWHTVHHRFITFLMVGAVALVMLASILCQAAASAFTGALSRYFPAHEVVQTTSVVTALLSATLLFAIIFKYLPDMHVRWRDVWIGAVVTALLLAAGQVLLAFYFRTIGSTSTFGAAGSLVAVLLSAYYSAQILLFGAELTRAYSKRKG